jgi:putative addiction module component (TIGR02574 family)
MTQAASSLLQSVLALSPNERAWLAAQLIASVDAPDDAPADVEVAWADEIRRRAERAASGAQGIPWEQVRAEARELLRKRA